MSSRLIYDAALNDSDKSLIIPADKRYQIFFGSIVLIASAVVGNRQIAIEIIDSVSNVIYRSIVGAFQAESTTREYHFSHNVTRETTFLNGQITFPIPDHCILLPGYAFRVYDMAAIDPTADDMTLSYMIEDRELNRFDPQAG